LKTHISKNTGPRLVVECTRQMAIAGARKRGFGSYAAYIIHLLLRDQEKLQEIQKEQEGKERKEQKKKPLLHYLRAAEAEQNKTYEDPD